MTALRVLIADDHPLFRKGMRALLRATTGVECVGEAKDGREAVEMAISLQPDLLLMDLQMPEKGGLEATREVARRGPGVNVLVVTLFEDDESVFAALRAGARGYILKDADEEEMVRAIQAVGAGQAIFSPAIASRVVDFFAQGRQAVPAELFPELTNREREILALISQGKSNAQIEEALTISLKTVRNHVSNIYSKLQVADRAQAVIRAREAGLGRDKR